MDGGNLRTKVVCPLSEMMSYAIRFRYKHLYTHHFDFRYYGFLAAISIPKMSAVFHIRQANSEDVVCSTIIYRMFPEISGAGYYIAADH